VIGNHLRAYDDAAQDGLSQGAEDLHRINLRGMFVAGRRHNTQIEILEFC
jgi:hypothetical protein